MPTKNPPLIFSIINTIRDISRADWDNLFGENIIEGYGYQKTLEETNLKEFSFGYLIGKREQNLKAIIPFFVMDFSFDALVMQRILRSLILKLQSRFKRFLKMKIIFLGAPTTEEFYWGVAPDEDLNTLLENALEKISEFCKREKIRSFLFYNLSEKDSALAEYLMRKKFIKMEGLPTTRIKIQESSLQDYINKLSKNTRKDLRRKLRRSAKLSQLTTQIHEDISDIADEVYKLYLNNLRDSGVHFEVLTPEFFQNISGNMPGVAKFFITYNQDKIVAFNLCLTKGDLCIDKFIGFDANVSHKYHLYYTTFCHNLDWCIKNGFRFYQPGVTDYGPKIRLGARLIPLYIYAQTFNPLLSSLIRLFVRFIEPRNLDPSLKDIESAKREF